MSQFRPLIKKIQDVRGYQQLSSLPAFLVNANCIVKKYNKNRHEPYAQSLIFDFDPNAKKFEVASQEVYNRAIETNIKLDPRDAYFHFQGQFYPVNDRGLSNLQHVVELRGFNPDTLHKSFNAYKMLAIISAVLAATVVMVRQIQSSKSASEVSDVSDVSEIVSISEEKAPVLSQTSTSSLKDIDVAPVTAPVNDSQDTSSDQSPELQNLVLARDNLTALLTETQQGLDATASPDVLDVVQSIPELRHFKTSEEAVNDALLYLAEAALASIMSSDEFDDVAKAMLPLADYIACLADDFGKASPSLKLRAEAAREKDQLLDASKALADILSLEESLIVADFLGSNNQNDSTVPDILSLTNKVLEFDPVARHSTVYSAEEFGFLDEELQSLSTEVDEGDGENDDSDHEHNDTIFHSTPKYKESSTGNDMLSSDVYSTSTSTSSSASTSTSHSSTSSTSTSSGLSPKVSKVYVNSSDGVDIRIFSGNGNEFLAYEVCSKLNVQLARASVSQFADGETAIQLIDNVRGKDCYVVQSLCGPNVHDRLMELLLMVSSLRRSSAAKVTAVIPYMAYARQLDHNTHGRTNIGVADIAIMLESLGVDHVVAVDLHRPQVMGFFAQTPVENLDPLKAVIPYLIQSKSLRDHPTTVVAPAGVTAKRAAKFQQEMQKHGVDAALAFSYLLQEKGHVSSSDNGHHGEVEAHFITNVVGNVANRDAVIVDDMVDSGSRVCTAAAALKAAGARKVYAFATHGLFSGDALKRIKRSAVDELIIFNTVPLAMKDQSHKVRQLSAAGLIAETIRRLHKNKATCDLTHNYAEYS